MSTLLQIQGVQKIFQTGNIEVEALKKIDLDIVEGEFSALAGPSGSGKTTLLNLIGGIDVPTAGKIFLEGKDLASYSDADLADLRLYKMGFIFQAYNLIPVLTAFENAEFVLLMQKVPKEERQERVAAILKEVGLEAEMHKRPNEMSGGQQQRVAVARAIVAKPKLILADEPTANLDSKTGGALLDLMRELNEKHKITFLFSTHDSMVMERAQRLVMLQDGNIVDIQEK